MSLQLHYEKNSMRKSYRTQIPLKVYLDNNMFDTYDWSLRGLSIKSNKSDFKEQNFYDAVLVLDLSEANISLKVKLKLIYKKDDKFGFEFDKLSNKNSKLLRRYLELHLDGKLDQVDSLMAVYEEPEIAMVISEPIKLNDDEKKTLKKSFLRKSVKSIVFSLFLLGSIGAILYHNLQYQFKIVGTVEGNYKNIYSKNDGTVENIYIKIGDKISKNDILVDLNSEETLYELKILETIWDAKNREKKAQEVFQKRVVVEDDKKVLHLKKQLVNESYIDFQNAKMQFKNRLITKVDMQDIKRVYLSEKQQYELYKKQVKNHKNANILPPEKIVNIEATELKIADKKKHLERLRTFSPIDATIFSINAEVGDNINKKEPLLTLWTHQVPQIICTLDADKAIDIEVGSEVEIVDTKEKKRFKGIVKSISNLAYDKELNRASSKDASKILVVIQPDIGTRVLQPHSIVKVLFKRKFWFDI